MKKNTVYLVGGYLRNLILGREGPDRDYAVSGSYKRNLMGLASELHGKLVRIGKHDLNRIVLSDGTLLDFTPLKKNIEHDLFLRDFTINALAWSPHTGLIDISQGLPDLKQKVLRMIRVKSLSDDPVRILRAYRISHDLSFTIENNTRMALQKMSPLLDKVKKERITDEFFRILNTDSCHVSLRALRDDGILKRIIIHNDKCLSKKIEEIAQIKRLFRSMRMYERLTPNVVVSQGLTYRGLLHLEVLMKGLPECRLSLSSLIQRRLNLLNRASRLTAFRRTPSKQALFTLFSLMGDNALDYLVIHRQIKFIKSLEIYRKIDRDPLLSTDEIKTISGLPEGRDLGKVIINLKKEIFFNKIRSKRGAERFLRRYKETI